MGSPAQNYTDLSGRVERALGYDRKSKSFHWKKQAPNIVLALGVIALVGAISFSVTVSQTTQDTQASEVVLQPTPTIGKSPAEPAPPPYLESFPTNIAGTEIPESLYGEGKALYDHLTEIESDRVVINRTVEYFAYRNALISNGITLPEDVTSEITPLDQMPESFFQMERELDALEEVVTRYLVTHADFYFLIFRFLQNTPEENERVEANLGESQQAVALELANEYQSKMLEQPNDIETILSEAESDERLQILNSQSDYSMNMRELFTVEDTLLSSDEEFHTMLYNLEESIPSEPYEYANPVGNPLGYVVVLPTAILQGEYETSDEVIQANLSSFTLTDEE